MSWYIRVLQKYAVFSGRARRKEYWMFVLFNILINIGISIIEVLLGMVDFALISFLYGLFILIPSLAVTVRRLHDINQSGWWILFGLIPIIGGICLLVMMLQDSYDDTNKWGPNPKDSIELNGINGTV